MPGDLLKDIEAAEAKAEEIRLEAQREAGDIVKSTEEACAANERETAKNARERAAMTIDRAKTNAQDEINSLKVRRRAEREALRKRAETRVEDAADRIFERIVLHGDL